MSRPRSAGWTCFRRWRSEALTRFKTNVRGHPFRSACSKCVRMLGYLVLLKVMFCTPEVVAQLAGSALVLTVVAGAVGVVVGGAVVDGCGAGAGAAGVGVGEGAGVGAAVGLASRAGKAECSRASVGAATRSATGARAASPTFAGVMFS